MAEEIPKSNIIFDVKPWDESIDLSEMEAAVRGIEMDGLLWGTATTIPIAYGISKLRICCVIEDNKVSSDSLEAAICAFEDMVQSIDVLAFNKV